MTSVKGIGQSKNSRKLGNTDCDFPPGNVKSRILRQVCSQDHIIVCVILYIISHNIGHHLALQMRQPYNFRSHYYLIGTLSSSRNTHEFSTVMERCCNLKQKPFSVAETVIFFHGIKNCLCHSLHLTYMSTVAFIPLCHIPCR